MKNLKDKTIGVLMGGLSPEREVSIVTGNSIIEALNRKGLNALPVQVDHEIWKTLQSNPIDLAFIALHGTFGEDGCIQGLLEYFKIPYTGPGVMGSALAYDKLKSKEIFKSNKIPTADYEVFYKRTSEKTGRTLDFPVVVKPTNQGSSLGISIVKNENEWKPALKTAFTYSDEVIAEKFIEGKLLAIGMQEMEPMPIVHIRPKSGFYDYEAKYTSGKTEYICPADLEKNEADRCRKIAQQVFHVLRGRGFPRVDVILDNEGIPFVLEMNTVPGMTPTSLLPMAAQKMGLGFDDLVVEIIKTAQRDY
ncbi:MAG TPA: D-alanine--D-alanine ligase [Nitrospinaceae bacterium]|nr:D-alanine--D-alanine ligase [Nitrospinaceae bacterium]